jgi:hypothetical protein
MAILPATEADYQAESDIDAMRRTKEVEKDPARLARAKNFAERREQEFRQIADEIPGKPVRRFNGAVRGSKMDRKG